MDDFEQADYDDYLLDRAHEKLLQDLDWAELHGYIVEHPTFTDAVTAMRQDRIDASRDLTPDDVLRYTGRGGENLHD